MDAITSFLESFDLNKILPKADTLLDNLAKFTKIALLAGPILLLLLGLVYLFLSPKEANHRFGFRTWFGMGSVAAWRFTQRLAGIFLGVVGLVMTIVMLVLSNRYIQLEPLEMLSAVFTCLIWQGAIAITCYICICFIVAVAFDSKGNPRRK